MLRPITRWQVAGCLFVGWGALVACGCGSEESESGSGGASGATAAQFGTGGGTVAEPEVPGMRPEPLSDDGDALFDPTRLLRIDITIPTDNGSPSSWDAINDQAPAEECVAQQRDYFEGSFTYEGIAYDDVGTRTKGGCGSWRYLEEKPSLKLNLTWDPDETDDDCPSERRLYGQKRLTLNNGVQDESAMREHLAYRFYRAVGIPAPRTAAIQVYVNGEYYGIYQLIESIERRFLRRWFNTSFGKGALYEGSYWCDFLTGEDSDPEDGSCWEREFELDSCDDEPDPEDDLQFFEADGVTPQDPWQFLEDLIATLEDIQDSGRYFPVIGETVDWEPFLTFWAASSIIIDWDGYAQWQNNFRIYHDSPTDLWYFIPWGTDQTWSEVEAGTGGWFGRGDTGGAANFGIFEPGGDVARLCAEATGTDASGRTCMERYAEELYRQLEIFESIDWSSEIDAWSDLLDAAMQGSDPHREYTYSTWQNNVQDLRDFAESRASAVRSELSDAGYSSP